jgi:hypothetical protein
VNASFTAVFEIGARFAPASAPPQLAVKTNNQPPLAEEADAKPPCILKLRVEAQKYHLCWNREKTGLNRSPRRIASGRSNWDTILAMIRTTTGHKIVLDFPNFSF